MTPKITTYKYRRFEPKRLLYIAVALSLSIILIIYISGCKNKAPEKSAPSKQIIKALVAGQFYPPDAQSIKAMIEGFYKKTPDMSLGANLIGVLSPHAGYIYSGPVASYIYKNIPKNVFRRVVIIFPSHHRQFRGVLALDADFYETPLGLVKIDRGSLKKLMETDPLIQNVEGLYEGEHSMEVMLPFLQESLGESFEIIPLMMGDQSPNMSRRLAEDLYKVFGDRRILYIASSDMSHYHGYGEANVLDSVALTDVMNLDDAALVENLRTGKTELCGYGPTLTMINLLKLRGGGTARVLKHANSGDTQGDKDRVVGYGAVAFFSKAPPKEDIQ